MTDPNLTDRTDLDSAPPRMPRWVKLSLLIVAMLVVAAIVAVLLNLGGDHGPGRHGPVQHGHAPWSLIGL